MIPRVKYDLGSSDRSRRATCTSTYSTLNLYYCMSFLEQLCAPILSDLSRLRKLKHNPPPVSKKQHCAKSTATYNAKSLSLLQYNR